MNLTMATALDQAAAPKLNFPGPIGTKRRRMRSGGNVSSRPSSSSPTPSEMDDPEEKTAQTSKCKGATTIPIFLKKTYKMIDTCDPMIASWTEDGEMFVVKDPDMFAAQVIPQYFDHNKFSSFARQLNFYGFRKMQSKPIRNSDYDVGTAKHVTFFNENFKRGRCDLLKKIQRSTRGGTNTTQDHQREIQTLRDHVSTLEQKIVDMAAQSEERIRRLELDMLARMEQLMLTVQRQQQAQLQLQKVASGGPGAPAPSGGQANPLAAVISGPTLGQAAQAWDPSSFSYPRGTSVAALMDSMANNTQNNVVSMQGGPLSSFQQSALGAIDKKAPGGPTLPPHPKQKQLPASVLQPTVGNLGVPPERLNSLRGISGISQLSGLSGLARGASVESTTSAVLMRNSWEDKYFSMLMLDGNNHDPNAQGAAPIASLNNGTLPNLMSLGGLTSTMTNGNAPATVSDRSNNIFFMNGAAPTNAQNNDELSSVSSSELA